MDVRLTRSPPDGRDKASAFLTLERQGFVGEIGVWDTGECELGWGPVVAAESIEPHPTFQHRQLDDEADLQSALTTLVSCVCSGGP